MRIHKSFHVIGKVQGVGYRFSCLEKAHKNKIRGFVTNRRDGSVYVEAEGLEYDLINFKEWLLNGPAWARVQEVEEGSGLMKNFETFEIVR